MNTTRASRPIPIALTALVAFISALIALAVTNGHDARAHGDEQHQTTAVHARAAVTQKQLALRNGMRMLWEDHIVWTRLAVISLTTGSPDTEATVGRLLENQADIGDAITPYYGKTAGEKLTVELRRHILIAAELIAAAQAGDEATVAETQGRWERNADDIAGVLHRLNPRHFDLSVLKAEMRMHLKLTTEEVVARLQEDWTRDVDAYDRIHRHILHMSDYLASGIIKQFPKRFR